MVFKLISPLQYFFRRSFFFYRVPLYDTDDPSSFPCNLKPQVLPTYVMLTLPFHTFLYPSRLLRFLQSHIECHKYTYNNIKE